MSNNNNYKDVNRSDYLRSFLTELVGQKAMISFNEKAKVIYDFVLANPTNQVNKGGNKLDMVEKKELIEKIETFDSRGLGRDKEGHILIGASDVSKKFRKKANKILASHES